MAKARFPDMFLAALDGTLAYIQNKEAHERRWRKRHPGKPEQSPATRRAILRGRGTIKKTRKQLAPKKKRVEPVRGRLFKPVAKTTCDCKAWTLADSLWAKFTAHERHAWIMKCRLRFMSVYDVWMKYAIRHIERGIWIPVKPPRYVENNPRYLIPASRAEITGRLVPSAFDTPAPCRTFGCHYAVAARYNVRMPPFEEPTDFYFFRYHVESFLHVAKPQHIGFVRARLSTTKEFVAWEPWSEWLPTNQTRNISPQSEWIPNYLAFEYAPPYLNEDKTVRVPPEPDLSQMIAIRWLDGNNFFRMWPQWLPSKRGDTKFKAEDWAPKIVDIPPYRQLWRVAIPGGQ